MAIEWPAEVCPAQMSWGMVYNNRDFTSSLNNSQQIVGYPGSYWKCSLSLPQLTRDRERVVTAFLGRLQGRFGTFKLPAFTRRRTDNVGAPVVQTGAAMASTITLTGLEGGRRVFTNHTTYTSLANPNANELEQKQSLVKLLYSRLVPSISCFIRPLPIRV